MTACADIAAAIRQARHAAFRLLFVTSRTFFEFMKACSSVLALSLSLLVSALAPLSAKAEAVAPAPGLLEVKARPAAPKWELEDLNGEKVKLSDFKGKVVLLNFWATWCPPCRKKIPDLIDLHKTYKDKGFAVIGVSIDEQGAAIVRPFVNRVGVNYPILLGSESVVNAYGIEPIPATFLIDRHGRVAAHHIGFTEKVIFESEIVTLLAEKP